MKLCFLKHLAILEKKLMLCSNAKAFNQAGNVNSTTNRAVYLCHTNRRHIKHQRVQLFHYLAILFCDKEVGEGISSLSSSKTI